MKILTVDDDPIALEILKSGLEISGFSDVTLANSGSHALQLIDQTISPFECFLLDVQMPDLDGIELCSRIRDIPIYADTPLIMVTAMDDRSFIDSAFLAGATDYITKPFDILELTARVGIAQKLTGQMRKIAQNETEISKLSNHVKNLNPDVAEVPFNIAADGFIHFQRFKNLFQQLKHSDILRTELEVYGIKGFKEIASGMTEANLVLLLTDVAYAISEEISAVNRVFSYCGNGLFINAISNRDTGDGLSSDVKRSVQKAVALISAEFPIGLENFIALNFGDAVGFNKVSAKHPLEVVQKVLNAARPRKVVIQLPDSQDDLNQRKNAQSELERHVRRMVPHYLSVLNEFMGGLEEICDKILVNMCSAEQAGEVSRISHKIAGVAPTLGFRKLGTVALETERVANSFLSSSIGIVSNGEMASAVNSLLDEIEDIIVNNIGQSSMSPAAAS